MKKPTLAGLLNRSEKDEIYNNGETVRHEIGTVKLSYADQTELLNHWNDYVV